MRITKRTLPKLVAYARAGRVVFFDTETTGGSSWDEICQIGAAEFIGGKLTRTLSLYICPTCRMNAGAEAVHGLSMEFLRENGIAPTAAMRRFFEFLGRDVLLVAHNAMFDLRMLNCECEKFGLVFTPEGLETCDTLALSRKLRPDLERHTLANLIDALEVDGVNSHDALDDAMACAGIFFKLLSDWTDLTQKTSLGV